MLKENIKNNKFAFTSLGLCLIGVGVSTYQGNEHNSILWIIFFAFCISDFGWNVHSKKIKKLENRIQELESKLSNSQGNGNN